MQNVIKAKFISTRLTSVSLINTRLIFVLLSVLALIKPVSAFSEEIVKEELSPEVKNEVPETPIALSVEELKKKVITEMLNTTNAELVQAIGNIALIYRAAKDPKPNLSNILKGF